MVPCLDEHRPIQVKDTHSYHVVTLHVSLGFGKLDLRKTYSTQSGAIAFFLYAANSHV